MSRRPTELYRVRRIEPDGNIKESRLYATVAAASARARRWRRRGWHVTVERSSHPVTFHPDPRPWMGGNTCST